MLVKRNAAPVREQAANNIREAIIDGLYAPGQRLYEKELCERTGVSRTSVREALRQLEAEGIVKMIPNQGPSVASLTLEEARENYEVRGALESYAFKLFNERATSSQLKEIVGFFSQLCKAYKVGKSGDIVKLKDQFYDLLIDGCGNNLIRPFLRSINARTAFLRKITLSGSNRQSKSIEEIKKIIEHLKNKDGEAAYQASLAHVAQAQTVALKILEEDSVCGAED